MEKCDWDITEKCLHLCSKENRMMTETFILSELFLIIFSILNDQSTTKEKAMTLAEMQQSGV